MARAIDIRDRRLPGGRLTISSRTEDPVEYAVRTKALRDLLEDGERGLQVVAALRARRLSLEMVTEKVRGHRKGELLALLVEREQEAAAAAVPEPILLGATVNRFLLRVKAKQKPRTLEQYEGFCRGMENAFGVERSARGKVVKDVPVVSITMEQGEAWLHGPKVPRWKGKEPKPWSAARQNVAHAVAVQVWALALEADEERAERDGVPCTLTRNLWAKGKTRVRPPKVRKTRVVFLTRARAGRLLRVVRRRPEAVVMALGIYAGLRGGEMEHLRMGVDVRLERLDLAIQPRGGRYPWAPKTDNGVREVPIHPRLARWIRAHIRQGYAGETYLIRPAGADRPISEKTHNRWTVEAFARAGIPYGRDTGDGSTGHTLRHTFASWLAQADVQLMKIAALMGITTDEVEETYAHLLKKDLRAAVQRLGEKPVSSGEKSGALKRQDDDPSI